MGVSSSVFSLLFVAYFVSICFGLLLGGFNGIKKVHNFYISLIKRLLSFIFRTISDFFGWLSNAVRR